MARFINVPADLLDDPKTLHLSPAAKRLYVTGWAICDDGGNVEVELTNRASERWGRAAMNAPERVTLLEVLEDMQRLGFIRDLRRRGDRFQFKRRGDWLS